MFAGCRCPREPDRVLQATKIDGRDVLGCRRCGGVFVDATLGLRLLAVLDPDVPPHDEDSTHPPCPVCRADMKRVRPAKVGVDVDVCHRHGVWLDASDLALVLRAAAKALGKPVPSAIETLDRERAEAVATAITPTPADDWSTLQTGHEAPTPNKPPPRPSSYSRGSAYGYGPVDLAIGIVALPIEVSLLAVGALGSLFD